MYLITLFLTWCLNLSEEKMPRIFDRASKAYKSGPDSVLIYVRMYVSLKITFELLVRFI